MIEISNAAPDQKLGLTFGDLRQFVTDCMHRDMPDDAVIKANLGWGGQIKIITAKETAPARVLHEEDGK